MKKLTLVIEIGEKVVYLDESVVIAKGDPEVMLKKAIVYWDYDNIVKGYNDEITFGGRKALASPGYMNFETLTEFLEGVAKANSGEITIGKNAYDGTCRMKSTKELKMGKMGELLGFGESSVIPCDESWVFSGKVDINRELRYGEVSCDVVESGGSLDGGRRSKLVSTLPITSEQNLKGSVQQHSDVESKVGIQKGSYNRMTFTVRGNNGAKVGSILMELYVC